MNAIIFNLLNDNKEKIKEFLINFNRNLSKNFEKELLSYLFGKDFEEIFKLFSSCICCEDIFFETMILCDSDRLKKVIIKNPKNLVNLNVLITYKKKKQNCL